MPVRRTLGKVVHIAPNRYVRGQYGAAPDGGISCGNQPADMSMPTVDVNRVIGAAAAEIHTGA